MCAFVRTLILGAACALYVGTAVTLDRQNRDAKLSAGFSRSAVPQKLAFRIRRVGKILITDGMQQVLDNTMKNITRNLHVVCPIEVKRSL